MGTDSNTIALLLPELILVVFGTLIIVGSTFTRPRSAPVWLAVATSGFVLSGFALYLQRADLFEGTTRLSGPLLVDSLAGTMRVVCVSLGLLFVWAMARNAATTQRGEHLGMILIVFAGLMLVCGAGNLITVFLGLELISVPTYALLFLGGRKRNASEATAKYFFLSLLSSAVFLFGMALLFGLAGTVELIEVRSFFASVGHGGGPAGGLVAISFVFLFAGLAFKIAAVPFHFYAPDVYQSTSNGNAGLLAVVPKIAGIVVLVRLMVIVITAHVSYGWQIAVLVSMLTMTIGNVCALWQNNIRRMMAYSSIAHAGYMLIGVAVAVGSSAGDTTAVYNGVAATLLYLVMYAVASLGTFAVLCEVSGDQESNDVYLFGHIAGLGKRRPWMAAALAVFMFSLAGIPPLAGFWGKMTLLTGALATARSSGELLGAGANWFLVLAVVAVINAAIAAAYYLRLIGVAYFGESKSTPSESNSTTTRPSPVLLTNVSTAAWSAAICAVLLIVAGLLPGVAVERFNQVGQSLGQPVLPATASHDSVGVVIAASESVKRTD